MRLFLKYFLTLLVFAALATQARSQSIILDFANRKVSPDGMSWTFDLMGKGDAGYVGPDDNLWIALNIRIDLALPSGVTIVGGSCTGDPVHGSIGGSVQVGVFVPDGGPAGTQKLGLTLERADNDEDLNTSTFEKMATYKVNFSSPVQQGNPATPRLTPDLDGSSWSNFADDTKFRPFSSVVSAFPLPVKLISFDATKESRLAHLTWSTSEEVNSKSFEVQRSGDGKNWKMIAEVKAKGESRSAVEYKAEDLSPLSGENFYRLKMLDLDGTSAFSKIVNLKFEEGEKVAFYPNPVSDNLFLKADDLSNVSGIQIFNAAGLEVYKSEGISSKGINVRNLVSGMYSVKVTNKNEEVNVYKVLISK